MRILVTGSCGLIGGECVEYFGGLGHEVVGVDNNYRRRFFGEAGDTLWNLHRVAHKVPGYVHHESDICDGPVFSQTGKSRNVKDDALSTYVFRGRPFDAVLHCAAQPSHDFATREPELDYRVNVQGTHNLLEATRRHSPGAVFIFMSTNKVYDDAVNAERFEEAATRWDRPGWDGFGESTPLGASHAFGSHKREADELVRRYAREHGMRTAVLRGGCLTGPGHSGVEAHGFLSYLLKCALAGTTYRVFGHKCKQVRDNIHSHDVCRAMEEIIRDPHPGEAYNIGGGRQNSVSVTEAVARVEHATGLRMNLEYVDEAREGDHRCYITDLSKLRAHYPGWSVSRSLDDILDSMVRQHYWGDSSEDVETRSYAFDAGSVVMDVGGYRGAFTADMLKLYGCRVHLFEPVREFAEACRYRFRDDDRVTVHGFGLSGGDREASLALAGAGTSEFAGGGGEAVSLRDADAALREAEEGPIDLVSLNCEGAEFDVIPRLLETGAIKRIRNLQVQFHNVVPDAARRRDELRTRLAETHCERFCAPWLWESWTRTRQR